MSFSIAKFSNKFSYQAINGVYIKITWLFVSVCVYDYNV